MSEKEQMTNDPLGPEAKGWGMSTITYRLLGFDLYVVEGDVAGIEPYLREYGAKQFGAIWYIPKKWFKRLEGTSMRYVPLPGDKSPLIKDENNS